MDEASQLILDLQRKLQELDHKVAVYKQDMTSEYTKYAEGLLRDVPEVVSRNVQRAITEGMKDFPMLAPVSLGSHVASRSAECIEDSTNLPREGTKVQLIPAQRPVMSHSFSEPPTRGSHAREKEFQGVFTPNYLPLLLDSTDKNAATIVKNIRTDEAVSSGVVGIPFTRPTKAATSVPTSSSYTPESPLPKLPVPRRRNTDDISAVLDRDDSPKPRSALRRNSSSSKHNSPRRVRFEFEGEQFATTSSPRTSAPISESADLTVQHTIEGDSDDEAGCEMVEDIANSAPPKKVSSTQALRALSRDPIEADGIQWTPVSAPPDGSPSIEGPTKEEDEDEDEGFLDMRSNTASKGHPERQSLLSSKPDGDHITMNGSGQRELSGSEMPANGSSEGTDMTAEEDDILAEMAPLQPFRSHRATSPQRSMRTIPAPTTFMSNHSEKAQAVATNSSPNTKSWLVEPGLIEQNANTLLPSSNSFPVAHDENEELFDFDDRSKDEEGRPKHYIEDNSSSDEEETREDRTQAEETTVELSQYGRSPARTIVQPQTDVLEPSGSLPKAQSSSFRGGSMRGTHPFSIPVVNESVHAEAARMGPMNSFVGSLSGKSGPDASDMNSYGGMGSFRASSFKGVPMSLNERMVLEDYMEEQTRTGSIGTTRDR